MAIKDKFISVVTLLSLVFCGLAWGQTEEKIVINPKHPDSDDLINITITNTACFVAQEWKWDDHILRIRLAHFVSLCDDVDPSVPDFNLRIAPLAAGDYSIVYTKLLEGKLPYVGDTMDFSVVQAEPSDALSEGGINGFYYNSAADGHFVYIMQTDFTTLVVWNTFDSDGNQAWIFGTGDLTQNGRLVVAESYINRSSGYDPITSELADLEVEYWGQIEVNMSSCWEGTVSYESELPEFGTGVFPIRRLAYVKQLGCTDIQQ